MNMIYLIWKNGGKEYVKKISPFTKHKNKKVCIEALNALLHLDAPDAFSRLKIFLKGKDPELKEQAIKLSGVYRVKEAVPFLLEILGKRNPLEVDIIAHKLPAVHALGKIGDPAAIDTIQRLYNLKSILYIPALLEKLKLEIIKSLKNYPFNNARPLLENALKSKNSEIRELAQKLLEEGRNV